MPAKKVKVDVSDKEGNKFTVTFEGVVTREKILQLLDLVEILGGVPSTGSVQSLSQDESKFSKVFTLIQKQFPLGWFSSKTIQSAYSKTYGQSIGLSTVSTYLSRLSKKGTLQKSGSAHKRYRLLHESVENTPIQA